MFSGNASGIQRKRPFRPNRRDTPQLEAALQTLSRVQAPSVPVVQNRFLPMRPAMQLSIPSREAENTTEQTQRRGTTTNAGLPRSTFFAAADCHAEEPSRV